MNPHAAGAGEGPTGVGAARTPSTALGPAIEQSMHPVPSLEDVLE